MKERELDKKVIAEVRVRQFAPPTFRIALQARFLNLREIHLNSHCYCTNAID